MFCFCFFLVLRDNITFFFCTEHSAERFEVNGRTANLTNKTLLPNTWQQNLGFTAFFKRPTSTKTQARGWRVKDSPSLTLQNNQHKYVVQQMFFRWLQVLEVEYPPLPNVFQLATSSLVASTQSSIIVREKSYESMLSTPNWTKLCKNVSYNQSSVQLRCSLNISLIGNYSGGTIFCGHVPLPHWSWQESPPAHSLQPPRKLILIHPSTAAAW